MTQARKHWKSSETTKGPDEADALLFENEELRNTAADLMLQTAILREALRSNQAETIHRFD